ncbi:MAG: peroxidase-related enzyme [Candidatus Dormibacteria bacterium]
MISRFPVPEIDDLPADLAERILEIGAKTGFVPNVFLALAHRPAELRAFMAYHDAVMEREGGLTKAEREMIVVATSAVRSCTYCVVAHGAILRVRAKQPELSDLVATNYRLAPITSRQRRMLDYAVKLSTVPEEVGEDDMESLRAAGFEDDAIWDMSAVVALFALSNRMALALDIKPNKEFYLMGRLPRDR